MILVLFLTPEVEHTEESEIFETYHALVTTQTVDMKIFRILTGMQSHFTGFHIDVSCNKITLVHIRMYFRTRALSSADGDKLLFDHEHELLTKLQLSRMGPPGTAMIPIIKCVISVSGKSTH